MKKFLIPFLFSIVACNNQTEPLAIPEPEIEASAEIYELESLGNDEYNLLSERIGTASFSQAGDIVTLEIRLEGLTPNSSKAVHIHNGTVNAPGRHWNQQSFYAFCNERSLGEVWAKPFAGDVGNVTIDSEGNGSFTIQTDLWALNSGNEKDILDKVVIVHQDPEDFIEECDPNHSHDHMHSNLKIGGGTITLTSDIEQVAQSAMKHFPDFTICK